MLDLVAVYKSACETHSCKPNSLFIKEISVGSSELMRIDLAKNFVGPKGCKAIIDVAAVSPNLNFLGLCDNQLDNDVVEYLCKKMWDHPRIATIDLSMNPISHAGGKMLQLFALDHASTSQISLSGTLLNSGLERRIVCTASRNLGAARYTQFEALSLVISAGEGCLPALDVIAKLKRDAM